MTTIQEKIELIRSLTDQKERKETAHKIMAVSDYNTGHGHQDNKVNISVVDYGEFIFISQQMVLKKEGE